MSKSKLFSYGFTLVAPFIAYLLKAPVLAAVTFIVGVVLITLSHLNKDEGHVGRVPSLADFLHQAVSTPLVEDDGEPRMGAIEEPHKPEETAARIFKSKSSNTLNKKPRVNQNRIFSISLLIKDGRQLYR